MLKLYQKKHGFGLLPLIMGGVGAAVVLATTGFAYNQLLDTLPKQTMQTLEKGTWAHLNAHNYVFERAEDFWQAEVVLNQKAKAEPSNPIPLYLLASLHQALGHQETAINEYQSSITVAKHSGLGQIAYEMLLNQAHAELAILYYQAHQSKMAIAEIIQVQPLSLLHDAELVQSLKLVLEAPQRADAHLRLGQLLRKQLALTAARQEFEWTAKHAVDPQLRQTALQFLHDKMPVSKSELPALAVYYSLAGDNLSEQHPDKAIALYERAIHEAPRFEWAYHHLGLLYHTLHSNDEAERYTKTALSLNPHFALPYLTLGDIAIDDEDYNKAYGFYSQAASLLISEQQPDDIQLRANIENMRAFTQENLGNKAMAKQHYQAVIQLSDSNSKDRAYAQESIQRLQQS